MLTYYIDDHNYCIKFIRKISQIIDVRRINMYNDHNDDKTKKLNK